LAIAITTAPRLIPTLDRSVASLRAAGVALPLLVHADGACPPITDAACDVVTRPEAVGALRHWVETLRLLLVRHSATHLLMLQDDLTWARRSARAIRYAWPHLAPFWTWYVDPTVGRYLEQQHGPLMPGPYLSTLGARSNGALCYGFTRELAEAILASPLLSAALETHRQGIDKRIPGICAALGQPLQVWVPGLVNHELGSGNSSIKRKPPKDTRRWQAVAPGAAWRRLSSRVPR
jgi:hypothetical protein